MGKFYITTPIYYVNAKPHIGHTYTTIAADVLARFHRMTGDKTFFLTGTDEHGAKIEEKARAAGIEPREFVDGIAAQFQLAWDELNISNDNFIRTTDPEHEKAVQRAVQHMYDQGDIYLGKYEGLYCQGCEQFLNEKDLIDGLCPDHKQAPQPMSEESYMFRLSKFKDELLNRIKNDEFRILPAERKNEILSFYEKEGLDDISFSRKNVKWGIPLPWDKTHTIYVWADAFLNYLTGLKWDGAIPVSKLGGAGITEFWPADIQLMSKDILRVHATIWPAMLLSLDLPLPATLFIHGFFLVDGHKMSKSIGNVIAPEELVKKYDMDASRYLLMSATTFGQDGDIGWEKFDEKFNADLANGLGNLLARSVTLAEKIQNSKFKIQNYNSKVENWDGHAFDHSVDSIWNSYIDCFNNLKLDRILSLIFGEQENGPGVVKFLDRYITASKPWELIKNEDKRVGIVIYNILEKLRHIAWMVWPFMPETADKIWESLGLDPVKEKEKDFSTAIKWGGLPENTTVKKGESLFPRLN